MPALINVTANFFLGALFAWASRRSPGMRRSWLSWSFLFLLGVHALVMAPACAFLFRFFPQWSLFYWFDPQVYRWVRDWAGVLAGVATFANLAAAVGGFFLVRFCVLTERSGALLGAVFLPVVLGTWLLVAYWERVWLVGSYDEYWHGTAPTLFEAAPGWIAVSVYGLSGAFLVWSANRYRDRDPSLL